MRTHYHNSASVTMYAIVERAVELNQCELIQPQQSWKSTELSSTYGEWDSLKAYSEVDPSKVFILASYCSGSDHSGNLVEIANMKALKESLPAEYEDAAEYIEYSGGFGTFALAIRLDALTPELLETLEVLEDYPVIDESLWSELETESQNEAWDSWAKADFRTALAKALVSAYEASPASDQLDGETDQDYAGGYDSAVEWLEDGADITDDNLSHLFMLMSDLANEYWVNEQGSDSYIDVEDVVNKSLGRKLDSDWTRKAHADKELDSDQHGNAEV
jgi:hypothetical protein